MFLGQGTDHDPLGCSYCPCSGLCGFCNDVCSDKESAIQTLLFCMFRIPYRVIAGIFIGARFVPDDVATLAGGKHVRGSVRYPNHGDLFRMFDIIRTDDRLFRN